MPKKPKPTGQFFFTAPCPHCGGSGQCAPEPLDGWYVHYHYQDGRETCGPYSQKQAVQLVRGETRTNATLIGPDGQIYTVG